MELWEFNTYVTSYGDKRKYDTAFCILSGFYEGLRAIEKIKALEQQKGV